MTGTGTSKSSSSPNVRYGWESIKIKKGPSYGHDHQDDNDKLFKKKGGGGGSISNNIVRKEKKKL